MARVRLTVRLDRNQLVRAKKALGAATATEAIVRALALVIENAAHDGIIREYSGVGGRKAFASR